MAATISNLGGLLQRTSLDDHEEVLKACNASLKKSKNDVEAQHFKAIALLKLDRYDEALRSFEAGGNALKERAPLEWAYTLYKAARLQEAADVAARSRADRGAKHLEAQASYRSEDFMRTAQIYRELSEESVSAEDSDLRVNRGATDAQLQWKGLGHAVESKKPSREDLEAFETAYNAACGSVARGELGQGEVLLRRATDLCKYSEDLSEDEKAAELLPIRIQQIYVLARLGKAEEAAEIAAELQAEDISDLSTRKIAQNNLLTISEALSNPFLSYKTFHSVPQIPKGDKLFDFQFRSLVSNSHTIDLQALKYDGVAASTAKAIFRSHSPTTAAETNVLSVLNAAAHARCEVGRLALKQVLPELEKRPNDVGLILTILQMYTLTRNHGAAVLLLESFLKRLDPSISETDQDVRFSPGLVGILIALYRVQGRKSHIKQELAKAASYWRHKSKPPQALLQAAGVALLESSNPQDLATGGEIFANLHKNQPNDPIATAGYVASHATTSPIQVQYEIDKLTPLEELIAGVDADTLEEAGIPQSSGATATALGTGRKRAAVDSSKPSKKRVRKSRLPKDYDLSKTPDPERWIPLRDRSSYRPKGKKGKQRAAERTQGGVTKEDDTTKALPSDNGKTALPPKTSGGGGGTSKKKKGKGKK